MSDQTCFQAQPDINWSRRRGAPDVRFTSRAAAQRHGVDRHFQRLDANSNFVSALPRVGTISKRDEIVVFWIVRDSASAECGEELGKGRFLRMETERPLCLRCADLDHLVLVERGDAELTRRASRYSTLRAVVVRFSHGRRMVTWWWKTVRS